MPVCHPSRSGWLLTDARLAGHGLNAARRLPPGSTIIVRSDTLDVCARRVLVVTLRRVAKARQLRLFMAGISAAEARRLGADGVHIRTRSARAAKTAQRLGLATSAPVHNRIEARAVARAGIGHALISPLYATRSHPGAATQPLRDFIALAKISRAIPVALGGMTAARAQTLRSRCTASGISPSWAAIDAWERS